MGVIAIDDLEALLSDVDVPLLRGRGEANGKLATASAREIYRNYKDVIPRSVLQRLTAKTATGDRSKVLWKLTNALLECGVAPGEVVVLVEKSVWNKFEDDRSRLWADVNKAASRRDDKNTDKQLRPRDPSSKQGRSASAPWSVPVDKYLAVESRDPQWMIEGLWSDKSHGIIAGEPKTRKSYLGIDIGLSVATGTDCLGHFPVTKPGPVLMIQEEISDAEMRKRLRFIAASKGLGGKVHRKGDELSVYLPEPIPLYLRNRQQFSLDSDEHLEELNRQIVDKAISLVIFDPLQMMLGSVDENSASQVRPILQKLLKLKEATDVGIMIVHHYSKASATNPKVGGQRMLGSQAFHGWVESALYLSKPDKYVTEVQREFRNFEPAEDFTIEYVGGEERYEIEISEKKPEKRKQPPTDFEKLCLKHEGVSLKVLARHLKIAEKTAGKRVEESRYVKLGKKQDATGRPKLVVIRR